ncbi:hypothetical protein [Shewanella frigidimarina]|uniref:hypothetical protein n=1 Tax=Shewanella frigidimarina TaxID=56812 RepID=UPI000F4F2955|nr:hypothetical protein [Shewanella frigidimarina]RPA22580.1 hypothetical protein EGC78_21180 [Shewanella frigidimarina]
MRILILLLSILVSSLARADTDLFVPISDELINELGIHIVYFGLENGIRTINIGYCNKYFESEKKVAREAKGVSIQLMDNDLMLMKTNFSIVKKSGSTSYTIISYQSNKQLLVELGYGFKGVSIPDRVITLDLKKNPLLHSNSKELKSEIRAITSC